MEAEHIEDIDGDGRISPNELSYHIKKEMALKSQQPPQFWGIVKSCLSGLLRGFLMGILLNGLEGAIVTSIALGTINPIMTTIEHMY
jgi:hypothetical protein